MKKTFHTQEVILSLKLSLKPIHSIGIWKLYGRDGGRGDRHKQNAKRHPDSRRGVNHRYLYDEIERNDEGRQGGACKECTQRET